MIFNSLIEHTHTSYPNIDQQVCFSARAVFVCTYLISSYASTSTAYGLVPLYDTRGSSSTIVLSTRVRQGVADLTSFPLIIVYDVGWHLNK